MIQAIYKFIYLQSAVFIMVHYMSSYLGICLKLSGTQGATYHIFLYEEQINSVLNFKTCISLKEKLSTFS